MTNLLDIELARAVVNERLRAAECARLRYEARSLRTSRLMNRFRRHTS